MLVNYVPHCSPSSNGHLALSPLTSLSFIPLFPLSHASPICREWQDGVLTAAARAVVKEPLNVRSWIVCDGDVDPEWIESLNSVRAATPPSVMCMQTSVYELKPSLRWLWGIDVDEVSLLLVAPLPISPLPPLSCVRCSTTTTC
jgi:hypothetical protein